MRQATGGEAQRKRANGLSGFPVRCIDGGWEYRRIGDLRGVRSQRELETKDRDGGHVMN